MKYVNIRWLAAQAAMSIRDCRFLLKKEKKSRINKNVGSSHKYAIISFVQKSVLTKNNFLIIQKVVTSQKNFSALFFIYVLLKEGRFQDGILCDVGWYNDRGILNWKRCWTTRVTYKSQHLRGRGTECEQNFCHGSHFLDHDLSNRKHEYWLVTSPYNKLCLCVVGSLTFRRLMSTIFDVPHR